MSSLLQRARESGRFPPSLISDGKFVNEDGFENAIMEILDITDFSLSSDSKVAKSFASIVQKASSVDVVPGDSDDKKKAALEQRRAILLAIVAGTPANSPSVARVLSDGYLNSVKLWLDDILNNSVGGVDFLLHLLSSIVSLPVTKTTVKDSGMGKAIGTIEKHRICKGTPNESAITSRVHEIKEAWNASVKALKAVDPATSEYSSNSNKRPNEESSSPTAAKRLKAVETKKSSAFSSLLKKVTGSPKQDGLKDFDAKGVGSLAKKSKKTAKRVKWSDHFGGALTVSKLVEGEELADEVHDTSVTWSDRKKRDRMREKELLAKAKKSKLMDDDDDELDMPSLPTVQVSTTWNPPSILPERTDVTTPNVVSSEMHVQNERVRTVPAVYYSNEYEVPSNPTPLTDVEQALDMTAQSSAVVVSIPFFVPEQPAPAPPPVPTPIFDTTAMLNSYAPTQASGATPEFLLALGLPMFLVGQNVHSLQTLASSPSLLSAMVDANGAYDQGRLMSLVQTLSITNGSQPPAPAAYSGLNGMYGTTPTANTYSQTPSFQPQPARGAFRAGSSEGNLHVSGYGPTTTQAEIIALFSPYVQVDQVVMKGTFSFVNTSDPVNAQRAREALSGTLLGGMPIRINPAQRKNRDSNASSYTPSSSSSTGGSASFQGNVFGGVISSSNAASTFGSSYGATPAAPVLPPIPQNNVAPLNVDAVRDDRGNPATKNLFVAGYGQSTTEQEVRDLFNQHVNVIGVVSKGSFSFVNTADRSAAVRARQMLSGTVLNGGVLRINFAKETGRLGTSFDLTYGPNTGPNAPRNPPNNSYYGRTF